MADNELFLALARLLWSFTFHEVPGETICLDEYEGLSGRTPFPFKVVLKPRHGNVCDTVIEKEEVVKHVV